MNCFSFISSVGVPSDALSGTAPALIRTPAISFVGSDSFTNKVNDGEIDSAFI